MAAILSRGDDLDMNVGVGGGGGRHVLILNGYGCRGICIYLFFKLITDGLGCGVVYCHSLLCYSSHFLP